MWLYEAGVHNYSALSDMHELYLLQSHAGYNQDTFLCGALWDTAVAGFINSVWSRTLILKKDTNAVLEKVTLSSQVKSGQVNFI